MLENVEGDDHIEAAIRKAFEIHAIRLKEPDVLAVSQFVATQSDHLRRDIDTADLTETVRKMARHAADAAANFENAQALWISVGC